MLNRTPIPVPETAADDPRIGHLIGRRPDEVRVVIVGFPSDEGVRRNGGRVGAAGGPTAIRQALYRMTLDPRSRSFADLVERAEDAGDVMVTGDLEADQQRLGEVLAPYLEKGVVPIILGGGHETAYGHFLGYVKAGLSVEILNWDAHADVRPLKDGQAHSGSPFRQALEHPAGRCLKYTVAGLLPHTVARAHLDFVAMHGDFVFTDALSPRNIGAISGSLTRPTMVTFDLDAVEGAQAPGVSAPSVGGMPVGWWLEAAREAGCNPHVRSMDVSELNPRFDLDARTARLAALTVWHFLAGMVVRP